VVWFHFIAVFVTSLKCLSPLLSSQFFCDNQVWPQSLYPLMEVGRMVLDRNPENYFAEVEQLAFAPSHMVPGIEPSPDKMLQGRLFSYADTHRHRLGVNYQSIPVNCPFASKHRVNNYQRDGNMRVDGNQKGAPNYFPNSFGGPAPACAAAVEWVPEPTAGDVARAETGGEDNFTQCGIFYRNVLNAEERERLTDNIAGNLVNAQEFIQKRAVANFAAADAHYGQSIRQKLDKLKKKAPTKASSSTNAPAKLSPKRSFSKL
jgi:catalase